MLLPDEGSRQLGKGCESMKLSFRDIKQHLHYQMDVEFEVCPVGGHNMHGKVERKIQEIKSSMNRRILNEILRWETLVA